MTRVVPCDGMLSLCFCLSAFGEGQVSSLLASAVQRAGAAAFMLMLRFCLQAFLVSFLRSTTLRRMVGNSCGLFHVDHVQVVMHMHESGILLDGVIIGRRVLCRCVTIKFQQAVSNEAGSRADC